MAGKNLFFVLMLLVALCACKKENIQDAPIGLTVSEGFTNPIGFYDAEPSFSWKLPVLNECRAIIGAGGTGSQSIHADMHQYGATLCASSDLHHKGASIERGAQTCGGQPPPGCP